MRKINTVLFDLDGTLVNSNELIIQSFKVTFKKYQPNIDYSRKQLIDMIGPPLKETFKIVSKSPKIIKELIAFYRDFYQENEFYYITIYPHVIELLKELKRLNINLGIVTTKFKESAMPSINHYNLNRYIDKFSFLGSVKEHKPSPQPIKYVLDQFDNVDMALMVGDNPADIQAGKNANILTCGVGWSLVKDKLIKEEPNFLINDYLEILDIIKKER